MIEPASLDHVSSWSRLRTALWPSAEPAEHQRDIERIFLHGTQAAIAFMAIVEGEVVGFAEASVRRDYVNGCESSPVAFLEGIYVAPAVRRQGVAKALCNTVEDWGRQLGCPEFASDTSLDNHASQQLHLSLGFEETQRVVFFRKRLNG
ncbi:aminoglycoside 6'-N-acetyltransferase [Devosia algicola]|uniref:aminoglycoside 6'-N-acetyltransferase n=1 Tax=Devosia algicola TaxID=3026418 RepID=UPI00389926F2